MRHTTPRTVMCFDVDSGENCMYCGMITRTRFSVDCEDVWDSELCYESVELYHCYNCDYSLFLRDSSDCSYSYDLLNCQNCFGCVGLRRSSYCIFNKQYSKEEYKEKLQEVKKWSPEQVRAEVEKLRLSYPHLASRQYNTENSFGDNIQNSRNCFYGFNVKGGFDVGYLFDVYTVYGERYNDSYDALFSVDLINSYENIQVGDGFNTNFCLYCEHLKDSEFCDSCFNSNHLFGCVSQNRKEYMILNQQYSKEDWHKTTDQLRADLKKSKAYTFDLFLTT